MPGLLESAYEAALENEPVHEGIEVERQVVYPPCCRGRMAGAYIADMVVATKLVLELKSVKEPNGNMETRLLNYLRLTKIYVGYLIHFRNSRVEWKRRVIEVGRCT